MTKNSKVFSWKSKQHNKIKRGYVIAQSLPLARIELKKHNVLSQSSLKKLRITPQDLVTLNDMEVADFFLKLCELTRSGINVLDTIKQLRLQSSAKIYYICHRAEELLSKGHSLSSSLLSINPSLNKTILSMLIAGEATGNMEQSFEQIATLFQRKYGLKRKIKKSLSYPIFVLAIAAVIILVMLIFVIPQFGKIFADYNVVLPLITRALLALSNGLRSYGILLIIGPATTLWLCRSMVISLLKKLILPQAEHLPLFGRLNKLSHQWLVTTILGATLSAGVSVINAFTLLMESSPIERRQAKKIIKQLNSGHSIATVLENTQLLEETHIQQIALAETSGNLDSVFQRLSISINQELIELSDKLNEFIEPIFISMLGLILGMIIIALYIPLFKLGDVF
jgi:type IV pilus assembly protein PilC